MQPTRAPVSRRRSPANAATSASGRFLSACQLRKLRRPSASPAQDGARASGNVWSPWTTSPGFRRSSLSSGHAELPPLPGTAKRHPAKACGAGWDGVLCRLSVPSACSTRAAREGVLLFCLASRL